MEDIQLIKELQDKLSELETHHDKKIAEIYEILDQLLSAKNEENQKEITKSQA